MPIKNPKPGQNSKPKVAIVSLTSCEGCQFVLLDLGEDFINLTERIDLVEMHLIEETPEPNHFDIAFVEGNPITDENIALLEKIREKSDIVVALGNCAALGGVWEPKNYRDKEKLIRYIYKHEKTVANPDIKEIDNFVKVDFTVPGCPINGLEFVKIVYNILAGMKPPIAQNPVCYECQYNGYECQLQKNLPCLGPFILGGCDAICLKSKMPCQGCRGFLNNIDTNKIEQTYARLLDKNGFNTLLEHFGIRDNFEQRKKHASQKNTEL